MTDDKKPVNGENPLKVWRMASELGYVIAVPIVAFALIGRFADKSFGTSPLLLLLGIALALIVTGLLVWKKIKNLI